MKVTELFENSQHFLDDRISRIGKGKYSRILKMARKPTADEYLKTLEITGFGLILVGAIGFLIYYLMAVIFKIP